MEKDHHKRMREAGEAMHVISFFDEMSFVERAYLHLHPETPLVGSLVDLHSNMKLSDLLGWLLDVLHHTLPLSYHE
jgi:hypothetical protein